MAYSCCGIESGRQMGVASGAMGRGDSERCGAVVRLRGPVPGPPAAATDEAASEIGAKLVLCDEDDGRLPRAPSADAGNSIRRAGSADNDDEDDEEGVAAPCGVVG